MWPADGLALFPPLCEGGAFRPHTWAHQRAHIATVGDEQVTEREPPASRVRQHRITPGEINRINREFWAVQEAPRGDPSVHPGITALVREAHRIQIRAMQETHDEQRVNRTAAATRNRRSQGDSTRDEVHLAAQQILAQHGPMTRDALADLVAYKIRKARKISVDHVVRILKQQAKNKRGKSSIGSCLPKKP